VKVGLGTPHPTGVVHDDWLLYPKPCLSLMYVVLDQS
jgi:hypothetical protein